VALGLFGSGGSDFDTMNKMNARKNPSLSKTELPKLITQVRGWHWGWLLFPANEFRRERAPFYTQWATVVRRHAQIRQCPNKGMLLDGCF
jgi:hypothetical protein